MTATRAFVRVIVFTGAGALPLEGAAGLLGLPEAPAYLLGGFLGVAAACVPWRGVRLRLLGAWLRAFPGRDLAYLAIDYGRPDREPEAPARGMPRSYERPGTVLRLLPPATGDEELDERMAALDEAILSAIGVPPFLADLGHRRSIILPGPPPRRGVYAQPEVGLPEGFTPPSGALRTPPGAP